MLSRRSKHTTCSTTKASSSALYSSSRPIFVLTCEDHATVQDRDGTKIVYILLPYFRRGNLQDAINANLVNHTSFPELELLKLFRGVCVALEQLHEHKVAPVSSTRRAAPRMEEEPLMDENAVAAEDEDEEVGQLVPFAHRDIKPGMSPLPSPIPPSFPIALLSCWDAYLFRRKHYDCR